MRNRLISLLAARRRRLAVGVWLALTALGCSLMPVEDSFFVGRSVSLRFSEKHFPYYHEEIIFSHELHTGIECETCHGPSQSSEEILAGDLPPMATCFDCHDGGSQSKDCETCHRQNRHLRKPRFHTGVWTRNHREMAYHESYKCELCHAEKDCQQCHAYMKPRSHTLRFNRTTHGRYAIQDRRSCATCHVTDFCVNCHNQPPPDHTPTFMGPVGHRQQARLKLRACLTCHQFANDCAGAGCHTTE